MAWPRELAEQFKDRQEYHAARLHSRVRQVIGHLNLLVLEQLLKLIIPSLVAGRLVNVAASALTLQVPSPVRVSVDS